MKCIKYHDFCSINFIVKNIFSMQSIWSIDDIFDYEDFGRSKNLLYYQIHGQRDYFHDQKPILTLQENDIILIPDKTKYYTSLRKSEGTPKKDCMFGIGISFDLFADDFTPLKIDEPLKVIINDSAQQFCASFNKILHSAIHCNASPAAINGEFYSLLYKIFSNNAAPRQHSQSYMDIIQAIDRIESHPEENISTKELASLCFMSESSFLKRFKSYSGGISPLQYRNNIRLNLAEELIYTNKTLNEIAELLGFYDAPHLCRIYKQHRKKTLKKSLL